MSFRACVWLCLGMLTAAGLAGCYSNQEYLKYYKAMSARMDNHPTYNESTQFFCTYMDRYRPPHQDYVMWSMDYASLCLLGGNYDAAADELMKCHADIKNHFDQGREALATATNESAMIFKGEHFERAMVCTYLSMLNYMRGNYNEARIFAAQANMENATKADDMKAYRDDFQLAHYWLARSYLRLGQEDNARIAFQKASEHSALPGDDGQWSNLQKAQESSREKRIHLEKESYALAGNPKQPVPGAVDMSECTTESQLPADWPGACSDENPVIRSAESKKEFFSVDFQKEVNLILVVETGMGPYKFLTGPSACLNMIVRAPYEERSVLVYLNGHKAGKAMPVLDMADEAATRGTSDKVKVRLAKGVAKTALSYVPYAGMAAAMWQVQADHRYWHLLPGEVYVFAVDVKPGLHTVTLQCLDSNGNLLPRYRVTRYYVPVKNGEESVVLMHIYPEADNLYVPPDNQRSKMAPPGVRAASGRRAASRL